MKILNATALALLLATDALAQKVELRNFNTGMAVDADVQQGFYQRYPDLADEKEVVAQASRELAAEGGAAVDGVAAADRLAVRARSLLSRRSPQEWQRKAVSLFPELGEAGSEFNKLFLERFRKLQETSPTFLEEPSWPVLLAKRCDDELRQRIASPATAAGAKSLPTAAAAGARAADLPKAEAALAPRANKWLAALSFIVLLGLVSWPAVWLWRCSRAFAGEETSRILWQRALRPAAWTFLGFGLIALTRTFVANADLGLLDRFGITLIVSVLAAAVFAVPGYAIALAFGLWQRRRATVMPAESKAKA